MWRLFYKGKCQITAFVTPFIGTVMAEIGVQNDDILLQGWAKMMHGTIFNF